MASYETMACICHARIFCQDLTPALAFIRNCLTLTALGMFIDAAVDHTSIHLPVLGIVALLMIWGILFHDQDS
jgi:hypothetical protein